MYAVIRQGSHQYRIKPGDIVQFEKLDGVKGDALEINDVLLIQGEKGLTVGSPTVEGAVVKARIVRQDKSPKVIVYKFKRRKGYSKKYGHRQPYTEVMITSIQQNGQDVS